MRAEPRRGEREAAIALALGLLVAVPVASLVVLRGWPGVYGQDAFWYQAYADEVRAAILAGRLPGPFTWAPGYPVLVAAVSLLAGPGAAAGQIVSLVAGAAVAVLTWLLARELRAWTGWAAWTPVMAGLVAGVTPHLWQSSAVVMSDTTGLAAMTLGAWAVARWARGAALRWAVLGAVATAFAVDVRQADALAAVPLAVAAVAVAVRRSSEVAAPDRRRYLTRTLGLPLMAAAVVLAPMLGPMAAAWAAGDPVPFSTQLASHPWSLGNLLRSETAGPDGVQRWPLPMGAYAVSELVRPYHLGPVMGGLAVAGAVRILARCRAAIPLAILVAWPGLVLLQMAGDVVQNTRFALAALPPAAILATGGVDAIAGWLAQRGGSDDRRRRLLAGGALAVAGVLAASALGAWRFTDGFIGRFEASSAALQGLVARVPADGRLVSFGATLELRHGGREVVELSTLTPEDAAALAADGRPTWAVVPAGVMDTQWAGTPIGVAFRALGADGGAALVAADGPWELRRSGPGVPAAP